MLIYRIEKKCSVSNKTYGFFTAPSWGSWPKHISKGLDKFFLIYTRHCNRIPKPTPTEENLVISMNSNLIVGCKSLEDLFYVWFDGVYWALKEALELYQLSVYEVEDDKVKVGKVQVVINREDIIFKHHLSYQELEKYLETTEGTYVIPKEIFNMTNYC